MKRPTISDLAQASGVSVSTVNRVLYKPELVRKPTKERVLNAAKAIDFYGVGTITQTLQDPKEVSKLGILLLQRDRPFYQDLGNVFMKEVEVNKDLNVELTLEYLDGLSPENVSEKLIELGKKCESVALVAAQHPLVADAIDKVLSSGVSVTALIAPLSARGDVGYVGLDNWKVGRTAAWAFDKIVYQPGKIGILIGNHRYRNQEINESGFRSYFREHNSAFTLLEAQPTYESAVIGRELVENLFKEHHDLAGLYVSGGGITGVLTALREEFKREDFVVIGYELFDETRSGLINGTLTMIISHPMKVFVNATITAMINSKNNGPNSRACMEILDFEIYTPENI
ncbi:MAG: LacI family DNA-binding transcriptional regulator [Rhodobacteraceae bacterium]|nr:LacI family DNA-binding transcriptional regulator [Paracoccaceae bacterium]